MILLDTNAVIVSINQRVPNVRRRLESALLRGEIVAISSIVLYELRFGIAKSAQAARNAASLNAFLTLNITPCSFDVGDAEEAGEIRAGLERSGTPIGPYDT